MTAVQERSFRAMNTDVRLLCLGTASDVSPCLERAAAEFVTHEQVLSRFDPASELSALNRAGEGWVPVSPLMFHALSLAATLLRDTGGLYNPGVLAALESAGYDRSFEQLAPVSPAEQCAQQPAPYASSEPASATVGTATQPTLGAATAGIPVPGRPYELHSGKRSVRLAPGVRLDLGGIGKGLAVDAAATALAGCDGFLIDAGGDIRAGGQSPDGGPWGVAVQDPDDLDRDLVILAVTDTAVATSSVARRRWLREGTVRHHLIDPRTGRSAGSDVLAATVVAPSCARAEVLAKAAVIAGAIQGFELLARQRLAGLIVDAAGVPHPNERMKPYLAAREV